MGATLTEKICQDFPDIAGRILETCVHFRNEDQCDDDEEAGVSLMGGNNIEIGTLNY